MDKEKLANGIMPILLKHTKEEYVGATGYIKFHEEDFLLFAKELAERIEIDREMLKNSNELKSFCKLFKISELTRMQLIKMIAKACPVKLKEADDEKT